MPTYTIADPTSKKQIELTGDSPPTEQELNDIFSKVSASQSSLGGIKSEPVSDIEAQQSQDFEDKQARIASYTAIDPNWQTLSNPEVVKQIHPLELVDIMKANTAGVEAKSRLKAAVAELSQTGTAPPVLGIRDVAYKELLNRGFDGNTIIAALGGESPTFAGQLVTDLPEQIGGIIGAGAGAILGKGSPRTVIAGELAGATVGGAVGKGVQQAYRTVTGDIRAPQTMGEALNEMAGAGLSQGEAQLVGMGLSAATSKVLAPGINSILPGATEAYGRMRQYGSVLTPAQMTRNPLVDTIEGVSESAIASTGALKRVKQIEQPGAIIAYKNDVINQIAGGLENRLSPSEAGEVLLDTLQSSDSAFRLAANKAYENVDKLSQKIPTITKTKIAVDTTSPAYQKMKAQNFSDDVITKVLGEEGKQETYVVDMQPAVDKALEIVKRVESSKGLGSSSGITSLANKVAKWKNASTFTEAHAMRSDLLEEVRKIEAAELGGKASPKLLAAANEIANTVDKQIETAAQSGGKDVLNAWRAADSFYKTGKETFNSKIIRSLSNKLADDPQTAVKTLFQPGATENIKKVYGLLDETKRNRLTSAYVEDLIGAASKDDVLLGESFLKKINDRYVSQNLKTVLNPTQIKELELLGNTARLTQARTGGSGKMLIQLRQSGALLQVAGAMGLAASRNRPIEALSGIILTAPVITDMLLTKPWMIKWLTAGLKTPAGTPQATKIATRLAQATKIATRLAQEYYRYGESKRDLQNLKQDNEPAQWTGRRGKK